MHLAVLIIMHTVYGIGRANSALISAGQSIGDGDFISQREGGHIEHKPLMPDPLCGLKASWVL